MTEFSVAVLALTILPYVMLDGFDLGVGMLFGFAPNDRTRRHMLAAIAPVWNGNETWLVLNATILFAAFPLVYATLLSAFYLPVMAMLAAHFFRGVAFEFRGKSRWTRSLWDFGFVAGSFTATFVQGVTVGALVQGLAIVKGHYVGSPFDRATPFTFLCGVGSCIGYALLGAGWLTYKTRSDVQAFAFRLLPGLLGAMLIFLGVVFFAALTLELAVMRRWQERPVLAVFPFLGASACVTMAWAIRSRRELLPFLCGLAIFGAAFGTLAVSFYPYMIPFSIRIADAVAPRSSIAFLFWGAGVVVLPITLIYTLAVFFIFKGKVATEGDFY